MRWMARSIAAPAPRRLRAGRGTPGPRPIAGAAGLARTAATGAWRRRRLRIALIATLVALPLLAAGWLWLRHSSLVAVRDVTISGVHGRDAEAIDAALTTAARRMSTLDVQPGALMASVASLHVVSGLHTSSSLPHGLHVYVSEQPPVAVLAADGVKTAIAANGIVLGPQLLSSSLPTVATSVAPAAGKRVHGFYLLAALAVLGDAPAPLAHLAQRAFTGPKGLTIQLRGGLLAYFGDDTRPHAKWDSLARVLADASSHGASYVDVRVPAHPAAGFPAGVLPPDVAEAEATGTATGQPSGASETTVGSLAAGLTAAGGASSSGSEPSSSSSSGSEPSGSSSTGSEAESEASSSEAGG
jgi:cell division protein FtsQ